MTAPSSRQFFLNIAVAEPRRSIAFFEELGFAFDPNFTNDSAACMIINSNAYAMLLSVETFKTFTKRQVCETATHSEGIFAVQCESRQEVDELVHKAINAGGSPAMDPTDHGFMYGWSFCDPDGHHWEVFWMDPTRIPGQRS